MSACRADYFCPSDNLKTPAMARLEDKIAEIKDPALRQAIEEEVKALKEHKTFGLVFEYHQPEVVPLFNARVKTGEAVAQRSGKLSETYRVERVRGGMAELVKHAYDSREAFYAA